MFGKSLTDYYPYLIRYTFLSDYIMIAYIIKPIKDKTNRHGQL